MSEQSTELPMDTSRDDEHSINDTHGHIEANLTSCCSEPMDGVSSPVKRQETSEAEFTNQITPDNSQLAANVWLYFKEGMQDPEFAALVDETTRQLFQEISDGRHYSPEDIKEFSRTMQDIAMKKQCQLQNTECAEKNQDCSCILAGTKSQKTNDTSKTRTDNVQRGRMGDGMGAFSECPNGEDKRQITPQHDTKCNNKEDTKMDYITEGQPFAKRTKEMDTKKENSRNADEILSRLAELKIREFEIYKEVKHSQNDHLKIMLRDVKLFNGRVQTDDNLELYYPHVRNECFEFEQSIQSKINKNALKISRLEELIQRERRCPSGHDSTTAESRNHCVLTKENQRSGVDKINSSEVIFENDNHLLETSKPVSTTRLPQVAEVYDDVRTTRHQTSNNIHGIVESTSQQKAAAHTTSQSQTTVQTNYQKQLIDSTNYQRFDKLSSHYQQNVPSTAQHQANIPRTTQHQANIPSPIRHQANVPSPIQQQANYHFAGQHQPNAPSPTQHQANVPSPTQHQTNVPSPTQHQTNVPSPTQHQTNVPSPTQHQTNVPSPTQHQTNVPSPTQHQTNVPSPTQHQTNVPSPTQHQTNVPSPTQHQTNVPSPTQHQTNVPSPTQHQTNVPSPTQHQTNVPSPTQHQTNVPSPIQHQTNVPSPTQHQTNVPSPTQHQTNVPSPTQHQTNDPSPTQHQTNVPSPTQHQTNVPSPTQHQANVPSPTQHQTNVPSPTQHQTNVPSPTQHQTNIPSRNQLQDNALTYKPLDNCPIFYQNQAHFNRAIHHNANVPSFNQQQTDIRNTNQHQNVDTTTNEHGLGSYSASHNKQSTGPEMDVSMFNQQATRDDHCMHELSNKSSNTTSAISDGVYAETRNFPHLLKEETFVDVDESSTDLLLIGNSGNGKSATGNSILNRAAFKRSASSTVESASSTSSILKESTRIGGKAVNVIDGPSINYFENIQPEEVEMMIAAVGKSLELCNCGFTSLLIVLKFGNRFTKQENEAIRVIKSVLGKNVIRDYGVCVITHGDNFEYAVEEAAEDGNHLTFDSWIKGQTGEIQNLFKECNNRCVLIDNLTKDDGKRRAQVENLLSILPHGKKYSGGELLMSGDGQNELAKEAALPHLLKQMQRETDNIREKIGQTEKEKDINEYKLKMEQLVCEIHKQKEILLRSGQSSPDVEGINLLLSTLETGIHSNIKKRMLSNELKNYGGTQNTTALESHRASTDALLSQQSTPALTSFEARIFLDNFRKDLKLYEKTSDSEIHRGVLKSLLEKLDSFHGDVAESHSHEWASSVINEIAGLKCEIFSKIKVIESKISNLETQQDESQNEAFVMVDVSYPTGSRSGAVATYSSGQNALNPESFRFKMLEALRKRFLGWYHSVKEYGGTHSSQS